MKRFMGETLFGLLLTVKFIPTGHENLQDFISYLFFIQLFKLFKW